MSQNEVFEHMSEVNRKLANGKSNTYAFRLKPEEGLLQNAHAEVSLDVYGVFTMNSVGRVECWGNASMVEALKPYCNLLEKDITIYLDIDKFSEDGRIIYLIKDGEPEIIDGDNFPCFALFAVASIPRGEKRTLRFYELSRFPGSDSIIFHDSEKTMQGRLLTKNFFLTAQLFGKSLLNPESHQIQQKEADQGSNG